MVSRLIGVGTLLALLGHSPAQAGIEQKLKHYPLIAQAHPNWNYQLGQGYSEETIARIYARYDALIANRGFIDASRINLLAKARTLNPRLALFIQWPIWQRSCARIFPLIDEFRAHLVSLGAFATQLDGIELDGAAVAARACGAAPVETAIKRYRQVMASLGLPAVLTSNGLHFPDDVSACGYEASTDGFGGLEYGDLPRHVHGALKESWVSRYTAAFYQRGNPSNLKRIGGLVDEACAWSTQALRPTIVFALETSRRLLGGGIRILLMLTGGVSVLDLRRRKYTRASLTSIGRGKRASLPST
jgi:hypothetical protein